MLSAETPLDRSDDYTRCSSERASEGKSIKLLNLNLMPLGYRTVSIVVFSVVFIVSFGPCRWSETSDRRGVCFAVVIANSTLASL